MPGSGSRSDLNTQIQIQKPSVTLFQGCLRAWYRGHQVRRHPFKLENLIVFNNKNYKGEKHPIKNKAKNQKKYCSLFLNMCMYKKKNFFFKIIEKKNQNVVMVKAIKEFTYNEDIDISLSNFFFFIINHGKKNFVCVGNR